MKYIFLLYILVLSLMINGNSAMAQTNPTRSNQTSNSYSNQKIIEPEDIKEPIRGQNEVFYNSQSQLWNNNAVSNPKDPETWMNYYKAERYSNFSPTNKDISVLKQTKLDNIVNEMEDNVPNSFEYNFAKYINGNYNTDLSEYLFKAYELQPNNAELYDDFIAYYEIIGENKKKKEFAIKLSASNTIPQHIYDYNYNLLMGLDKNAILITNGYDDTYPIWILQLVQNIRPDVKVLNLDILQNSKYRDKFLKENKLKTTVYSSYTYYKSEFINSLGKDNPQIPLYIGLTVNPNILKSLKTNLYLTGLAFKFSTQQFDNLKELETYWARKIDKSKISLNNEVTGLSKNLNSNYLIPMTLLENYYYSKGEYAKADEMYNEVYKQAKSIGKENIIIQRRARSAPANY